MSDKLGNSVVPAEDTALNQSRPRGFALLVSRLGIGLAALLVATAAFGQTNTGTVRGFVYDQTMAAIQGTAVTAVDEERGVEREVTTSATGEYVLGYLSPGVYTLTFEAEDFATFSVEGFEVLVGQTETFSPQLTIAAAEERVVVSADDARSFIEPQRVQQSDHIDAVEIQNLPINRRDYLDLALLTPGVVNTNYTAEATDRRIAPTPQSGLGIGGTNGRGNTFMIDGLDNTYNSGAVRSAISQETVREFQVNRNSFSPEQGGAPGGAVNIVTKSGSNEIHGSLFGVVRNRRFQAREYFAPTKPPYTRAQSGFGLGGPIQTNKTFFYGSYERLDRHESQVVPLLTDRSFLTSLTPSQQTLATVLGASAPPTLQPLVAQLGQALTPGNYPHIVDMFERNSGIFPFGEQRQQGLVRFDHTLRDGHSIFFRLNGTGQDSENTNFGSLVARSAGRNNQTTDFGFAFGDTLVINHQWVSETRVGVAYHDFGVYPTDGFGPAYEIGGFGTFGRDFILPTRVVERAFQVRQNFVRVSGRQTLKFGVDINPVRDWVRSETFFGGRFIFGEAVPLSSVIDQAAGAAGVPNASALIKGLLTQGGATALVPAVDAPISALQSFALGLPTIYQQGFGDPYWLGWANRTNFYVEDAIRVTPTFMLTLGLRHELELKTRFPRDYNNFAPRAGFAWSPNPKTVVRGGYGFFYARIDGQIGYVNDLLGDKQQIYQVFIPLTGVGGITSALTGQPLTSAEIYQTLQSRGVLGTRSIVPEDLAIHGIAPSAGYPLRVGFRVVDDTVNPYSQQGSFEIQRELAGYTLSAGYNFNRGVHLIRPLDLNVFQAGTNEATGRPIVGFHNPLILQDNAYGSWGRSYYHAMILQFQKRFSDGFSISAHHTWSKSIDESTDYNSSFEPHLQWDARNELALSHFHRGHRFVAQAVAQSPWKAARGRGFGHNLLSDFTFSGIMLARSFAPFNLNAGYDNLGDRHTDTHRPWGVGRNVGIGPSFFGLDVRLTRSFAVSDTASLQVIAEGFNMLNKTNFKSVNGNVGQLSLEDLPDKLTGRRGPVTEPFSFTSTFEPRQFQFTVRLTF